MKEPVLTKKDVAKRLGVSTRTIQRLRLPHIKVGGQNRYLWSEVARALDLDAIEPVAPPPMTDVSPQLDRLESRLSLIEQELAGFRSELEDLRKQIIKEEHG